MTSESGGTTIWPDEMGDVVIPVRRVPGLTILSHPDPTRVGDRARFANIEDGVRVEVCRTTPEFARPGCNLRRPLDSRRVSRKPLRFTQTSDDRIETGFGPKSFPVLVDGHPLDGTRSFSTEELDHGVILVTGEVALLLHRMAPTRETAADELGLVGHSDTIEDFRDQIRTLAQCDDPVILLGESGTGKEIAARAIHDRSSRRGGPFVAVNMGAIPQTLAADQLFGHQKGAFSSAHEATPGFFGSANHGTLFLDEVGDAPWDVQLSLLRVLETGEIQRVGSSTARPVDVRVITATDVDLAAAAVARRFKSALIERFGLQLRTPPLRERRDDIPRLLFHFLRGELALRGKAALLDPEDGTLAPWLPADVIARFTAHDWPLNVRELLQVSKELATHCAQRPFVARPGSRIADILDKPTRPATPRAQERRRRPSHKPTADELWALLEKHGYSPLGVRRELGTTQRGIYELMDEYGIPKAADLSIDQIRRALEASGNDVGAASLMLRVGERGLKLRMKALGL